MDEQVLRARLAALDVAVHMATGGGRDLVNNYEMVTDAAEHFEAWLLRPVPVDVSPVDNGLCDFAWRNVGDDHAHRCGDRKIGHDALHGCGICGVVHIGRRT